MTAGWIGLGIGIAVAVLLLARWFRRDRKVDLGSVSYQWMAEQRMAQGYDSQR